MNGHNTHDPPPLLLMSIVNIVDRKIQVVIGLYETILTIKEPYVVKTINIIRQLNTFYRSLSPIYSSPTLHSLLWIHQSFFTLSYIFITHPSLSPLYSSIILHSLLYIHQSFFNLSYIFITQSSLSPIYSSIIVHSLL